MNKHLLLLSTLLYIPNIISSPLTIISTNKIINIYPNTETYKNHGFNNCNAGKNGEYFIATKLIQCNDIVFDVGANVGSWSSYVISKKKNIHFHAFEPVPQVFQSLKKNLPEKAGSIHNIALSSVSDHKKFYVYDKNNSTREMSSFHERAPEIEHRLNIKATPIIVQTMSLDDFCKAHQIKHINFLKIDTEGHELAVLKGANILLSQGAIDFVQFEYGGTYLDAQITLKKVYKLLSSHKYKIFRIISNGLISIPFWQNDLENYQYSNYLAIKSY